MFVIGGAGQRKRAVGPTVARRREVKVCQRRSIKALLSTGETWKNWKNLQKIELEPQMCRIERWYAHCWRAQEVTTNE